MTARADRCLAATTVMFASAVAAARLLLLLGQFRRVWLSLVVVVVVVGPVVALRARAPSPPGATAGQTRRAFAWTAWLPVGPALAALGLAITAAGLLPIWAWDAAGYHLPYVNFIVQGGASSALPDQMPFVSSYPHNIEILFATWRLMLADDTWLDAAQIPLGIVGAVTTMALARRWGARRGLAVAAGACWLAVPGVFLQLPSGYVDVGVAAFLLLALYWILGPLSPAGLVMAGLALGLFLGSKPSAPLPAAVLFAVLMGRAGRAGLGRWIPAAAVLMVALGSIDYLVAFHRFGNPLWPARIDLGPLHLPGPDPIGKLMAAGSAAPHADGPLPWRMWRSWSALWAPPSFDMRLGGLGSLVPLLAGPSALFELRRRPVGVWIGLGATLLGPDPATARFILAFPAVCLALAAVVATSLSTRSSALALVAATLLAGLDVWHAAPGLAGEGPPLWRYLAMSSEERLAAVGPDGRPGRWIQLRRSLGSGQAIAFDKSFDLSYLLWRRRLQNEVVFIADDMAPATVAGTIADRRVRFLIASTSSSAGAVAAAHPAAFRPLFACRAQPCVVYEVHPESLAGAR